MTPLPEPEVNPLIPDGIEKFCPRCIVCTNFVPPKRATSRSKDTCSPECHKVLRAYRKHMINSRYCPACYHPSSPEERRDFIQWRKFRGERAERPGRKKKPQPIELTSELSSAAKEAAEKMLDAYMKDELVLEVEPVTAIIVAAYEKARTK